jgi:glycerol-3-phosphate O-acyltransferase
MPTALVGTILITLRGNGVGEEEMVRKVTWLKKRIMQKKGQVAEFGDMSTREVIMRAAQVLRKELVGYRTDLLETVYFPVNRFELSFYRNQIIHLFVSEAIVSVALYSTVKAGGPLAAQKVQLDKLEKDAAFLSQLFKNEFVYGPGGLIHNLNETLKELESDDIISSGQETGPNGRKWVELSSRERKQGRETFDFFCFLLWPFVETYWLSAVSPFTILPQRGSKTRLRWVNERDFLDRAQFFGKTLYYEGW